MDIKEILDQYKDKNKSGLIRLINHSKELKEELYKFLGDKTFVLYNRLDQDLYNYYNDLKEAPRCDFCGLPCEFQTYTKGYKGSCGSKECNKKSRGRNIQENRSKVGSYKNVGRKKAFQIRYSDEDLQKEIEFYKTHEGNISYPCRMNKIIKMFQQDAFYKKEKEVLRNKETREKLYANREKYLNKKREDLSMDEIYNGVKISGIHYGYSHFSPLWFKWFIERYGVKKCYDPFGGWGHRLLGGLNLERYIYNDFSKSTKENVDNIIEYFKISNTITFNEDCKTLYNKDIEECDAWFTCPPYVDEHVVNIEHYECGDYTDKEIKELIDEVFRLWEKSQAKVFGVVVREDMEYYFDREYNESFYVGPKKNLSHFERNSNNTVHKREKLYIFIKD